ncbi:MAG: vitamin K epoxide reductase family protein [SAR324 cluster bacterium]|nr:vitamin K epoxide reductase family protein [SAR324 cluster bacterium]MBL7034964.1 vitamin K epoxide reductase family protein [SAR324 cluster bacterium]
MLDPALISLLALGAAALFGLQGALILAVKHNLVRSNHHGSACSKIVLSKEAFIAKIPVAYGAVVFYALVLYLLISGVFLQEMPLFWLNTGVVVALLVTCYYAYLMFFKLRLVCMGCLRIYLANLLMGASLLAYHFY